MLEKRIRNASLLNRIVSAEEAASLIQDGMTVGMSGFTRAGEAKAVPLALAERAKTNPMKITLMTGASLGNDLDKTMVEAGMLARRMPFQSDPALRRAINDGRVMFIDQHLSETVEQLRGGPERVFFGSENHRHDRRAMRRSQSFDVRAQFSTQRFAFCRGINSQSSERGGGIRNRQGGRINESPSAIDQQFDQRARTRSPTAHRSESFG